MVIVTDFIIMIISHKVPASNTFKSASTYESLCLYKYKNHLYILNSLGVECQFWKALGGRGLALRVANTSPFVSLQYLVV